MDSSFPHAVFSFVVMAAVVGASVATARGEESTSVSGAVMVGPLVEPLDAPVVDPFAGRTVRNKDDGYGIIAARGAKVPKVGQPAPLFALETADGKETIRLADYFGKKPVVLVFGSLT